MSSIKKDIEAKQSRTLNRILTTKYDCNSRGIVEINNQDIILLENMSPTTFQQIEKDVDNYLSNSPIPFSFQIEQSDRCIIVIEIQALSPEGQQ